MQSQLDESHPDTGAAWRQVAPLLDDALGNLGERDRHALVLRFFEGRALGEVGTALGVSEDAAKMRVNRALEKLRKIFSKRGVTLTAALIAGAVSANSVQAAPVGLAITVTATAAKGAAVGGSTLALVKGALKIMAWMKMKTAVLVGAGVLLAAGTTTVVVENLRTPNLADVDDKWFALDSATLEKAPAPVRIIRPTHFANLGQASGMVGGSERIVGKNSPFANVLMFAYGNPRTRTVLQTELPAGGFDFLVTLPKNKSDNSQDKVKEIMRQEIERKFGLVGREELREVDVLLLKVKSPNAPALKPSAPNQQSSQTQQWENERVVGKALDLSSLAFLLEGRFNLPVVNKTGLKGRYDFTLKFPNSYTDKDRELVRKDLLESLGLELVPSREKIEMLVVERVK